MGARSGGTVVFGLDYMVNAGWLGWNFVKILLLN